MKQLFGAVVLAAGQGTRLKMNRAKPLVPVLGKVLIDFSLQALIDFYKSAGETSKISVVTGHRKDELEQYLKTNYIEMGVAIEFAHQEKQLGTADALRAYFKNCPKAKDCKYTIVICADTPLIRAEDLQKIYEHLQNSKVDGVAATFNAEQAKGYGRIVRNQKGFHIVEEKDADEETKKIKEVNSGLYIINTDFILKHLDQVNSNNKSGEFYLTDLFQDEYSVSPLLFERSETFIGVNTLSHLEQVTTFLREEKCDNLRDSGVRFLDSSSNFIDWDAKISAETTVYPNVIVEGKSIIGEKVTLGTGSIINNSIIENGVNVKAYSVLEDAVIRKNAVIGPYARMRPGADIGEESKIGNFVEIKKSKLERGVKVSHLSYVGDAKIGEECNLGCGFITCNYDGASKHLTEIGKKTFIGSDSQMIAPVKIGEKCYVASGSTINKSMPDGAFAIARSKQDTKEGLAARFIKEKKS